MKEEITLDSESNEKNNHGRRFFAIKNQRGEYLSYNYGYKFTNLINNAKVYCTKDNAIQHAKYILQMKIENPKMYSSTEKVYVQELIYQEVE